jgi:hypothetical protein
VGDDCAGVVYILGDVSVGIVSGIVLLTVLDYAEESAHASGALERLRQIQSPDIPGDIGAGGLLD